MRQLAGQPMTIGLIRTYEPRDGGQTPSPAQDNDLILGGFAGDTIRAGRTRTGSSGDNGMFEFDLEGDRDVGSVITTEPTLGGPDTIYSGDHEDVVFGGTATTRYLVADITMLLGDHGVFARRCRATKTSNRSSPRRRMAGNDMIHGEGGDDFILGQGADQLFGDDGEDDITGGHNVTFGVDEGDRIMGGEQADVSGTTAGFWQIISTEPVHSETLSAPFADVIREVIRYDDIDLVSGHDLVIGGTDDDRIFGQRGNDTCSATWETAPSRTQRPRLNIGMTARMAMMK